MNILLKQRGDAMDGENDLNKLFNRRHERPGAVFNELLEQEKLVVAPGVYDAMGAQIARTIYLQRKQEGKQCSFNAVYGSGWAISAMLWGLPDMGFHDLSTIKLVGKYIISSAHPLPVIFDAETGFGNGLTLTQTVEEYDKMGVAVAHLEDQAAEAVRRCGNLAGKKCIEPQEMVSKIRSWLAVSQMIGTSMELMVRTDALTAANGGLQDAIERGKMYMDVEYQGRRPRILWADALIDPKDIEKWTTELHKHDPNMILGINYSPNKDWTGYYRKHFDRDPPTYKDLQDAGFNVMWHTILQARADMESSWNTFDDVAENGAQALWTLHERQRKHHVGDAQGMSNAGPWQAYEKHIGGNDAVERYRNSQGYQK